MWADGTLTVDFESETTAYTDWVFDRITSQITNSIVSAHGGTYFGNTGGVTTGSLRTKGKIANPKSITFYISKATDNTTASSWKVQVSPNGTDWTDVKTVSASSVKKGEWTEVTHTFEGNKNVYVRIYFDGTTAVRCIDDVTLTYSEESDPSTATYSINIADIMNGGMVKATPNTNIAEGTTVTLNATPNTGYYFSEWRVTNATTSESIEVKDNKFQMPASNVNVGAIFAQKQNIRITWSINGNTSRHSDLLTNDEVEFPTDVTNPVEGNTKTFVGWIESETIEGEPTFVTSGKATENKTYYAVFANKIVGGDRLVKITNINDITLGTYALICYDESTYVSNALATNACPKQVSVEKIDNKINIKDDMKWIVTSSEQNGGYYLESYSYNDKFLWGGSANDGTRVNTTSSKANAKKTWYPIKDETYGVVLYNEASVPDKRYLATYSTSDWRNYTSISTAQKPANLYKLAPGINYSNYTTTIENATSSVTLNAKGYASFSSDYELSIEGAKAYTATVDEEAKTITWNAIEDNIIPANEGVLLKGNASAEVTFAVSNTNKANISGNDMKPNLVEKTKDQLDGYIYVLSGENIIRLSDSGKVGANKAYLCLNKYITESSTSGAKTFTMIWSDSNVATGINNVNVNAKGTVVYNLAGQRVNENAKGIVIIDGKKYINK